MHSPILPAQVSKSNVIDTERNSFKINDNTKRYLKLRLSGIKKTFAGQNVSEKMDWLPSTCGAETFVPLQYILTEHQNFIQHKANMRTAFCKSSTELDWLISLE